MIGVGRAIDEAIRDAFLDACIADDARFVRGLTRTQAEALGLYSTSPTLRMTRSAFSWDRPDGGGGLTAVGGWDPLRR